MSVQSTVDISREDAIDRIKKIHFLASEKDYVGIARLSYEPDADIQSFVNDLKNIDDIEKWTDRMIEDVIDLPFYRKSMFDNYSVKSF